MLDQPRPAVSVTLPALADLARQWPEIEPVLKRATDRWIAYETIDVLSQVLAGVLTLFTVRENGELVAVIVTGARQYPRCRTLEVMFVAGVGNAVRRWYEPVLEALDQQAQALGCHDIAAFGRSGWAKFGFQVTGVTLQRRLQG